MDDYRVEVLGDVPGLTEAPPSALAELSRWWDVKEVEDDFVCTEGEAAELLWILAEGECDVIKTAPNTKRYKVARLTPGCLFGHVGVMTLARRTASVRANGRVKLLQMPARRARELLRSDDFLVASPFRRALIMAMARQLHSATLTTMKLAVDAGVSEKAASGQPRAPGLSSLDDHASEQISIASGQV
jgi:CRP-like cAMP-binding protein